MLKLIYVSIIFFFITIPSYAYLGPGMGGGALAAVLGIIVAVFAALFGLIWFPLKRFIKRKKEKKDKEPNKFD